MYKSILRFPNTEKEMRVKEMISKSDEKFLELSFFEDDEFKFDMMLNKTQLDYYYELLTGVLK